MEASELQSLIRVGLETTGLSASRASKMAVGEPGAIGRIFEGHVPSFERATKILESLGMSIKLYPSDKWLNLSGGWDLNNALALKSKRQEMGYSVEELSRIVDESAERISEYESGVRQPSSSFLNRVAACEPNWPRFLEHRMAVDPELKARVNRKIEDVRIENDDYINLPLMDIKAAAGAGKTVEYETIQDELSFRRDWLKKMGLFPRNLSLITAEGKSMEPDIQDGDVLLVNRADRNPAPGKVMVAFIDDHLVVKELAKSNGTWALVSKNLEYGFTILDDINALIGHVVWRGGNIN